MIKPDEIEAVRHFLSHCTLNDTPKVLGLCQQLLNEIELQQQIIEQHTNQFLNGELHATNQTINDTRGTRVDTATTNLRQQEPVRDMAGVPAPSEARHQDSAGGDSTEAEDDLPEYRDYRKKESRSPEVVDDSRLGHEMDREVRPAEGDVTPSCESVSGALTRNQRRRQKRKNRKANK